MARLAFDIGGTFTDFVLEDSARGATHVWKVLSTPGDPAEAVMQGIAQVLEIAGVRPSDLTAILHATTVATNAILERKGSRTALIATAGFRDVLLMGRQKRYDTYDLHLTKPAPLIARADIFEIAERITHDGRATIAPDPAAIDALLLQLVRRRYDSVAVAFLHAYANPAHERLVAERCRALGLALTVSLSSDVSPKFREYERTSTTVANAYVRPIVARYIGRLETALRARGISRDLAVMQSNGGLVSPELASESPVRIVESGPAAGVLMCRAVGAQEGLADVLTFDMGGTTAKLGAIDGGEAATLNSFEVDQVRYVKGSGLPLNISAIELLEIGAGGGSIARVDLGVSAVGPESAGSEPGPICYGRGGARPTVTDANLVLGYLNPAYFNGGRMGLAEAPAAAGIAAHIAAPLGLTTAEAAWGIHMMATANMERALRIVSVERGRDPRSYVLVGFGGAGPLHAARLARSVGIPTVIVPDGAGVGSAMGLLEADPKIDHAITRVVALDSAAAAAARTILGALETRAQADAARLAATGTVRLRRTAYCRYAGQGHEIAVDVPDPGLGDDAFLAAFIDAFAQAYRRRYGFDDPARAIEAIDWQITLTAAGEARGARAPSCAPSETRSGATTRRVYFPECGGYVDCPIHDRYALRAGDTVPGPCIVEERESTVVLLPGDTGRISAHGNLVITIATGEAA